MNTFTSCLLWLAIEVDFIIPYGVLHESTFYKYRKFIHIANHMTLTDSTILEYVTVTVCVITHSGWVPRNRRASVMSFCFLSIFFNSNHFEHFHVTSTQSV